MSDAETTMGATEDWPAKATTTVVGYVDKVRGATTGKALVISRAIVYFLAAGLLALVALVVVLILAVRLLVSATSLLPFIDTGEVWLAYVIIGLIFSGLGLFLWKKRPE